MNLTPYTSLTWAFQLHYYLWFRTHRRREFFRGRESSLEDLMAEICARHEYHLLGCQSHENYLRCLLSLRPEQTVAKTIQTTKANAAREWSRMFELNPPIWARGYMARSVGHVRVNAVRQYLAQQSAHHGYDSRLLPPVYGFRAKVPIPLTTAHSVFDLSHHLVFATERRKGIFTSFMGKALSDYWIQVAAKRGFAIDQVSIVPDHVHLLVRITPVMSVEECALRLLNNGQYVIGKRYPEILIAAGVGRLWQDSAYVGTCGEYTTGLIQKWLNSAE